MEFLLALVARFCCTAEY